MNPRRAGMPPEIPWPKKTMKKMSDCELGRYREQVSHQADILLFRLASIIKETISRGLPQTGVIGECDCKMHKTNEYHRPDKETGVPHSQCWSKCTGNDRSRTSQVGLDRGEMSLGGTNTPTQP